MKRFALILAFLMPAVLGYTQAKDSQGHTLVNLWKTFYKAQQDDLPQDQLKALEAIKKEAATKHLAWDWYDAATNYVSVRSSVNWKEQRTYAKELDAEVESFGEPVVVFFHNRGSWSGEKLSAYVAENLAALQKSDNPEFHSRDLQTRGRIYIPVLLKLLKNDYEYALWSLEFSNYASPINDYYKGRYPEGAFLEFNSVGRYWDDKAYQRMQDYARKYEGKAVSLMARQRCLTSDFHELNNNPATPEAAYLTLRKQCEDFERDRKSYKSVEKDIADRCTSVEDLLKTLDSKNIDASVKDGVLTLSLRNISSLKLKIWPQANSKAVVWDESLSNKKQSYYIPDTLKVNLPNLNDDDYIISCKSGDCEHETAWRKLTLSISVRESATGWGVFVADYCTGKPVDSCLLQLLNADSEVIDIAEGFKPVGFAPLPSGLQSRINTTKGRMLLRAVIPGNPTRRSPDTYLTIGTGRKQTPSIAVANQTESISRNATILMDRKVFNPGETVQFKVICYSGNYEFRGAPEGVPVKAMLIDPQGKEIETRELVTSDFGSVHDSFRLPESGSRNGLFVIRVTTQDEQTVLATSVLRVDELVLPTFELNWDADNRLYLPGDEVMVSGSIKAYSGHSLADAAVRYTVGVPYKNASGGKLEGEITPGPDGSFSFSFTADTNEYYRSYPVTVTITDSTGETLSFSTAKHVYNSPKLTMRVRNGVNGSYTWKDRSSGRIVSDPAIELYIGTGSLLRDDLNVSYKVFRESDGKQVAGGKVPAGDADLSIHGLPSGLYRIEAYSVATRADGTMVHSEFSTNVLRVGDSDTALNDDIVCLFKEPADKPLSIQFGTTDGPVWAVVELFDENKVLLDSQIVELKGELGKAGSLKTVSYERRSGWSDSLSLNVFWFHKGQVYRHSRSIVVETPVEELPLSFSRFTERIRPGDETTLVIKTNPDVECAVTAYDKATSTIVTNFWNSVRPPRRPAPSVNYSSACGMNESRYIYTRNFYYTGAKATGAASNGSADILYDELRTEEVAEDDATPLQKIEQDKPAEEPVVRENFAATMAWEPVLRSDSKGEIELKLKGADRLSTYYVQLFAHDRNFRNAALRREVVVTIPVKISLSEPRFLYEGDLYTARATLASTLMSSTSGRMAIRFYDGGDYRNSPVLATRSASVNLASNGTYVLDAPFRVPEGVSTLGVLVNFVSDFEADGSDALFVTIPVYKPEQTLTEAHSALLRKASDRERTIEDLREMFVNIDAETLPVQERSILDMIHEAIPDMVEPRGKDALSLTEAWYANVLARKLGADGLSEDRMNGLKEQIAACQNPGGGFAWFEGMKSSPAVTAVILQRMAAVGDEGTGNIEAAVKYLDNSWFEQKDRPLWCGGISFEQYLHTRALYANVPFDQPNSKALKEFKKNVRNYLTPSKARGLNGQILDKARRLRTLQLLADGEDGAGLAKAWGITLKKKLVKSLDADVKSLLQYAVEHRSGGMYYPNAVMPWRGLLESELYAHTLLCKLLDGTSTAEGIRLWMMIQKETQQWSSDPAYLEAIAAVLQGTPETLDAKVLVVSGTFTKPFAEVKEAGNGLKISAEYYKDGQLLAPGDVLSAGDRIKAVYKVYNEENRSFIRIDAARPASFRPVAQLSGLYGWNMAFPVRAYIPQGYRNVLRTSTEYWFDSFPEENSSISEEFFVTQEGEFQMPAIEIESLYAPHYRANAEGRGPVISR